MHHQTRGVLLFSLFVLGGSLIWSGGSCIAGMVRLPDVKLLSTTATGTSSVEVEVEVHFGSKKSVTIGYRNNGKLVGSQTIGPKADESITGSADVGEASKIAKSTIDLVEGSNKVEIALDDQEPSVEELIVKRESSIELPPRLFVLAIGINNYEFVKLKSAVADAKTALTIFSRYPQGQYSGIEQFELIDQAASASGIEGAFSKISSKIGVNDVFVVFVAGAGRAIDDQYVFFPSDAKLSPGQGIAATQFGTWMASIPAKKALLLVDTGGDRCSSNPRTDVVFEGGVDHCLD